MSYLVFATGRTPRSGWHKTALTREKAERLASRLAKKRDMESRVVISDSSTGRTVGFAFCDVKDRIRIINVEDGTVDGEDGFVLSVYGHGSDHDGRPDHFTIATSEKEALRRAGDLIRETGRGSGALVAISHPKGMDPHEPLSQDGPADGEDQPLRYTVQEEPSGRILVTDRAKKYNERRTAALNAELSRLKAELARIQQPDRPSTFYLG